jgi:predicted enzyme related to lactoylglutathione lyase
MTQTKNFYITYFAKTHNGEEYPEGVKMITRKAQEPNPKGTAGREFVDKNGTDNYVYWDLEARDKKTNELGAWRHATGNWSIKAI